MLIAFILMGAVLFLMPYFYKPAAPPKDAAKDAPRAATTAVTPAATRAPAAPAAESTSKPPAQAAIPVAGDKEELVKIETSRFVVMFSSRGAVITSWALKDYKSGDRKPLELVNTQGLQKVSRPFSYYFKDQKPAVDLNQALHAARRSEDGLGVEFEFSDGQVSARKSFRFGKDSYLIQVVSQVTAGGATLSHGLAWQGGFGDAAVENAAASQRAVYFDATSGSLETKEAKEAKDGPVTFGGNFLFAGLEDAYFAAVFMSAGNRLDLTVFSHTVARAPNAAEEPHVGAAVGGEGRNEFSLFVGPKDMDLLRRVNPKLERLIDFGWFAFIARPLFLGLNWLNDRYVHNYGWSIVVVTIIINFALLPLKLTSMKSMKRMQALQPQVAALNEKYKGISMRDPRKAQQNQELMDLYKKHGINPMGGCVPMLLQIPFFIAFYKVLTVAIELRGAEWLWVKDLSAPEHLPIRILPVAMLVSQFVMQKLTPTTTADPAQQRIMMLMPLMLGFMFYGVSSGLVLYWLTGNLVGIAQQLIINRLSPPVPVAQAVPAPSKSKKPVRK